MASATSDPFPPTWEKALAQTSDYLFPTYSGRAFIQHSTSSSGLVLTHPGCGEEETRVDGVRTQCFLGMGPSITGKRQSQHGL